MLVGPDPPREFERPSQQVFGTNGTASEPASMPMNATIAARGAISSLRPPAPCESIHRHLQ
jgi:hypothetical protein